MAVVLNFIISNNYFPFSNPKRLLSNNDTSFLNVHARERFNAYKIDHMKSSPYYCQANGQAEATTKLCCTNSVEWSTKGLRNGLILALWTNLEPHFDTSHTFTLVYGADSVVSIEVMIHSPLSALASKLTDSHDRIYDVEALEK